MIVYILFYLITSLLADGSLVIPTHKQAEVFGLEPRFNVVTRNVTIISGQTAVLPCSVDYLGDYKVVWLNHKAKVLTLEDRRIIADERISIERPYVKEWNLYIRQVKPKDQGVYTCQINTDPVQVRPVWLQVQEPPKIIDFLSSADVTVQEGDTVSLVCNVTGVPEPTVTWYRIATGLRKDGDEESERIGIEGEVLVIHNVTRYCDDLYECVATNGVPPSVNRQIRVLVEFPPEIRLPNRKIGQARGKETILECIISGYPQGVNIWKRKGKEIALSHKYIIEIYDEGENTVTLSLRIRSIDRDDFGDYECVANNILGSDSEFMTLYEYPKHKPTEAPTTTPVTTKRPRLKGNSGNGMNYLPDDYQYIPTDKGFVPPRSNLPPYDYDRNGHSRVSEGSSYKYKPGLSEQVYDDKSSAQVVCINSVLIGQLLIFTYMLQNS